MTKSKLRLAVDKDNTLGDYTDYLRQYTAAQKGIDPKELPDPTDWDFIKSGWPIKDRAEFVALHAGAVKQGMFRDMKAYPGASEGLWELSNLGVHIIIVTHRLIVPGFGHSRHTVGDTVEWLDKENMPYRDLCFLGDKAQLSADFLVDDGPHNIDAYQEAGRKTITFDQLYNTRCTGLRAKNWEEVVEIVKGYL